MIKRMLQMARPWWGSLILTVCCLIATSILNLVTPEMVRRLTAVLESPEKLTATLLLTYVAIMTGA